MNEATKNSLISALTSIIGVLGLVPAFAKFLPPSLTSQVPDIVNAIGVLIGVGALIYKMIPKPAASIIKGAAELPEVHEIVTTPAIAAASNRPEVVAK